MEFSNVFYKNLDAYKDKNTLIINQGGTSSTKTYSILQLLYLIAENHDYTISVMSESMPHLRLGAMRDFFDGILKSEGQYNEANHNKSNNTYKCKKGTIEFISADQPGKVHGPRRDILFINEAINVPYDIYDQAAIRTKLFTILDYNPVHEFWLHEKGLLDQTGSVFIKSTYQDALKFLPEKIRNEIEAKKQIDPEWWKVYGLGELGSKEGMIFPNFRTIDIMPEGKNDGYGMDFGFNDPTVLEHGLTIENNIYFDEIFYQSGLLGSDMAAMMREAEVKKKQDEIFADSSRPEMIGEIYNYGYNIKPVHKSQDFKINAIKKIKEYHIFVTKRSVNTIKELRNYHWIKDKQDKVTDKPSEVMDHAMDAWIYYTHSKIVEKDWSKVYL